MFCNVCKVDISKPISKLQPSYHRNLDLGTNSFLQLYEDKQEAKYACIVLNDLVKVHQKLISLFEVLDFGNNH